jgi:flagellar hook-associated protein 3 FlgL
MRITNNIISRMSVANLQRTAQAMAAAQQTATTGKRINVASDDPMGAARVMQSSESLRALDQYKRNIDSATGRLSAEENVLDQITNILQRAKELGLAQGSDTSNAATRSVTQAEVDQLLRSAIQLGNTQHEGEYLFGGNQSNTIPFTSNTPPFATQPPVGTRQTEISAGLMIKTNHDGKETFLDTNVMGALQQLSVALGANDADGIRTSIQSLDGAYDAVQNLLGDSGARASQLEVTSANVDALENQLKTFKSTLEDADLANAMTELVARQTAYQSALLSTSRVISLNLAAYLQ